MADKMAGLFDRRKKKKLYQQWVERDNLPPEEIPSEIMECEEEEPDESGLPLEPASEERNYRRKMQINADRRLVSLPVRVVLLGVSFIAFLLVIIAILLTVLIMKGC
ncbi:hypothetical protein ACFLXO_05980 [Chloroflexota bacterium]